MAKTSGQVCLNHPDRSGVSRCTTCFKPLCDECILERDGLHFCSQECSENETRTSENVDAFQDQSRRDRKRRRKRKMLVRLVILIVIVAAAWYWCSTHPKQAGNLWRSLKRTVGLEEKGSR